MTSRNNNKTIFKNSKNNVSLMMIIISVFSFLSPLNANAQQPISGDIVVFGDSFVANPNMYRNRLRNIEFFTKGYPAQDKCLQAPDNWPRQLSGMTNREVIDWSCSAQTSKTLLYRIDGAIAKGHLNKNTSNVIISVGMNDYAPFNIMTQLGLKAIDTQKVFKEYIHNIDIAKDKIRGVSPNAKIIMAGTLSVSEDYGTKGVCIVNIVPNLPLGVVLPQMQYIEKWNQDNQRIASQRIGATFVDLKESSKYHNTCAKDRERWVAGIVDTTTPNYNMILHPSYRGSRHIATEISKVLQ